MPDALYFTDDPAACELLAADPFALLVGFAIDQQVTVQKAFAGPLVLKERVGTLDPKQLATLDLDRGVRDEAGDPPLPGRDGDSACANSPRSSPRTTTATRRGSGPRRRTRADLKKRIGALPGFGEMKIKSLGAVLAKQFGVAAAEGLAPDHPTLGDVTSPEELERYQEAKRAYKARRVPESPERSGSARTTRCGCRRSRSGRRGRSTAPSTPRPLAPPLAAEPPRRGAGGVDCWRCAHGDEAALWSNENWCVTPLSRPTGLPAVVILETRAHHDFHDLPRRVAGRARPAAGQGAAGGAARSATSATSTCAAGATAASTSTCGSWRAPRASRS